MVVIANKNITGSKISVDKIVFGVMILILIRKEKNENKYHNASFTGLLLPKMSLVKARKLGANN